MAVLTSREVSVKHNPELPGWQHDANAAFIETAWDMLKPGGTWIYPAALALYRKVEGGWELVEQMEQP